MKPVAPHWPARFTHPGGSRLPPTGCTCAQVAALLHSSFITAACGAGSAPTASAAHPNTAGPSMSWRTSKSLFLASESPQKHLFAGHFHLRSPSPVQTDLHWRWSPWRQTCNFSKGSAELISMKNYGQVLPSFLYSTDNTDCYKATSKVIHFFGKVTEPSPESIILLYAKLNIHFEFVRYQRLHSYIFGHQVTRIILFNMNFYFDHIVFHTAVILHLAMLLDYNFINLVIPTNYAQLQNFRWPS